MVLFPDKCQDRFYDLCYFPLIIINNNPKRTLKEEKVSGLVCQVTVYLKMTLFVTSVVAPEEQRGQVYC